MKSSEIEETDPEEIIERLKKLIQCLNNKRITPYDEKNLSTPSSP